MLHFILRTGDGDGCVLGSFLGVVLGRENGTAVRSSFGVALCTCTSYRPGEYDGSVSDTFKGQELLHTHI